MAALLEVPLLWSFVTFLLLDILLLWLESVVTSTVVHVIAIINLLMEE